MAPQESSALFLWQLIGGPWDETMRSPDPTWLGERDEEEWPERMIAEPPAVAGSISGVFACGAYLVFLRMEADEYAVLHPSRMDLRAHPNDQEWPPISQGVLRRLPLQALQNELRERFADRLTAYSAEQAKLGAERELESRDALAALAIKPEPKRRPGRPRLPDRHFKEVAEIYMTAMQRGVPPVVAVRRAYEDGISHSTASAWVGEARRRGLLPPAPSRKARKPAKKKASR